jgi:hypothetical protein
LSVGLGNAIMGGDPKEMVDEDGVSTGGGMPTMEEMMQEAMGGDDAEDEEDPEGEELEDEEIEELLDDEEAPEPDTTE